MKLDLTQLSLLGELIGTEPHESDHTGGDPVTKRNLLVDALLALLAGTGDATLLVFEDVHWIDPTSKLLLGRMGQLAKTERALVVATIRGEGRAAATELLADAGHRGRRGLYPDHVTVHEVRELSHANGRRLALAAASSESLTVDARRLDDVVARSGGVPH